MEKIEEEEGGEGESKEVEEIIPPTIAEMELLDQITPLMVNQDTARIFMYHQNAACTIRREFIGALTDQLRELSTISEIMLLNRINDKAAKVE